MTFLQTSEIEYSELKVSDSEIYSRTSPSKNPESLNRFKFMVAESPEFQFSRSRFNSNDN